MERTRCSPSAAPVVKTARDLHPLTEWFEDGQFTHCTFALVTEDHHVYAGRASVRKYALDPDLINRSLALVEDGEIYPEAPANISVFSGPVEEHLYVKGPSLSLYGDFRGTDGLAKLLLDEALAFEALTCNAQPPNIVKYHGCLIKRGRIVGIVLARLPELLERRFAKSKRFDADTCMRKIESAVQRIHDLGRAHNDLKPTNIMLDHNDDPFVIDLGSCKPYGALLVTGGTVGWVEEDYTHSALRNDQVALGKIKAWLHDQALTKAQQT